MRLNITFRHSRLLAAIALLFSAVVVVFLFIGPYKLLESTDLTPIEGALLSLGLWVIPSLLFALAVHRAQRVHVAQSTSPRLAYTGISPRIEALKDGLFTILNGSLLLSVIFMVEFLLIGSDPEPTGWSNAVTFVSFTLLIAISIAILGGLLNVLYALVKPEPYRAFLETLEAEDALTRNGFQSELPQFAQDQQKRDQ